MPTSAVVHLIDDDDGVRHAMAFLLTSAGLAVRIYESAEIFLAALGSLQPGCIVSDVRMSGMDGLTLQRHLTKMGINLPMILVTGHADVATAVEAMKAGAIDFIEKPFDDELLLAAIRRALDQFEKKGAREVEIAHIRRRLQSLTPREREVLDGLVAGLPNKSIAFDLKLSPRTVEVHRANLMTKMHAGSLSDLVRMVLTANMPRVN